MKKPAEAGFFVLFPSPKTGESAARITWQQKRQQQEQRQKRQQQEQKLPQQEQERQEQQLLLFYRKRPELQQRSERPKRLTCSW